ncbi:MAG: hypothetical protein KKH74_15100 [Gammaproteobacteria bacterium]|nr:hypothetical protein [Gammaproteobacteria bacterium]
MEQPSAYHELGRFIVEFQLAEAALTDLLILMAKADDEAIRILINELSYSQRVKATDVMFARFVDLRRQLDPVEKDGFHCLMVEFGKLGERRNEIVHSKYTSWSNDEGSSGLLRENSRLRASKGTREEREEKLLPHVLTDDFRHLSTALNQLEGFRQKIIEWMNP